MTHCAIQNGYFIVLERGERVVESLTAFCAVNGVHGGVFSAIGAVEEVSIGYYNLPKKEYVWENLEGIFEVASMTGNVTLVEGGPFLHTHALLTSASGTGRVVGAHVREVTTAVTLEVVLTVFAEPLERTFNDTIGLNLCTL